jgi:hypothetical protein
MWSISAPNSLHVLHGDGQINATFAGFLGGQEAGEAPFSTNEGHRFIIILNS